MRECPRCRAEVLSTARFCSQCGTALDGRSPSQRRALWIMAGAAGGLTFGLIVSIMLAVLQLAGTRPPQADAGVALTSSPTRPATPTARAPTPTPFPTFTTPLLNDSFDMPQQSSLEGGQDDNVAYSFVRGAYRMLVKQPQYIAWSAVQGTYTDATVEVAARFERASPKAAAGIIFRYQDEQNYYFFSISTDSRYSLDVQERGQWRSLVDWTRSPVLQRPGELNHMRVDTAGETIRLYINGTLLDEVSDNTFTDGKLALAVNTFEQGDAAVVFDSLSVKGR